MKAIQFGAGNIGRGFLGQLYFEGGYSTTFIDANPKLIEALNERGEYPLRLIMNDTRTDLTIQHIQAIDILSDPELAVTSFAEADLAGTSVGTANLPKIAPIIAAGINQRARQKSKPINILLCENQWHASILMRDLLVPHIAPDAITYFDRNVGLVETVIGRMVPTLTDADRAEDPLRVIAEPFKELPVARAAVKGSFPKLPGLVMAELFEAYEARKLFLHNMSHAALAYLGWAKGYRYIWECVEDTEIAEYCDRAMNDVCVALRAEYGFGHGLLSIFSEDLLRRFANKALGDTVARVASDPIRKLRSQDRLVGAAKLCLTHGIEPFVLVRIINAAFEYDNPADPSAIALQELRKEQSKDDLLRSVCGLSPESPLARMISAQA